MCVSVNKLTIIWVRVWKLKLNLIMDKLPVGWFKHKKNNSSCVYFYPKYTFGGEFSQSMVYSLDTWAKKYRIFNMFVFKTC